MRSRMLARVHAWFGIALALPLLLLIGSGVLLLHKDALFLPRSVTEVSFDPRSPQSMSAELARLMENPALRQVDAILLATADRPLHTVEGGDRAVFYLPIAGQAPLGDPPALLKLEAWLMRLHVELLAGEVGDRVLYVLGPLAFGVVIAGATLWWPLRRGWRWRELWPRGASRALQLRHHVTLGAVLFLFGGLQFGSGALLVYNPQVRAWLQRVAAPRAPPVAPEVRFEPGNALAAAQTIFALRPGAQATQLAPISEAGRLLWSVKLRLPGERHLNGRSSIVLDVDAGRVVRVRDARAGGLPAVYDDWLYTLHIARLWGWPQLLVWTLMSLGLAALVVAGARSFLRRSRSAAESRPKVPQR